MQKRWHFPEDLYEDEKIKAIGISNFYVDRMVEFINFNRIKPMVEWFVSMIEERKQNK